MRNYRYADPRGEQLQQELAEKEDAMNEQFQVAASYVRRSLDALQKTLRALRIDSVDELQRILDDDDILFEMGVEQEVLAEAWLYLQRTEQAMGYASDHSREGVKLHLEWSEAEEVYVGRENELERIEQNPEALDYDKLTR